MASMKAGQPYRDRSEAGQILAAHVAEQLPSADAVVLALPRGGVPVGFEVARVLDAPLDVFMVRKLGVPFHPELAMGAIAADGFEVLNNSLVNDLGITPLQIAAVADRETTELQRREEQYRVARRPVEFRGRNVILVDDGLATGFTMRAAIGAVRLRDAAMIVVAVPVGAVETCEEIARDVDLLICPYQPEPFHAVGLWYRDFTATTDDEVRDCLAAAAANQHAGHGEHHGSGA
jgi:predicted phosphoribosyltransferase